MRCGSQNRGPSETFLQSDELARPLLRLWMMNMQPHKMLTTWFLVHLIGTRLLLSAEIKTNPDFFEKSIRPILTEYCLKCHSTEKQKGDLDLERFVSLNEVKKHPKIWESVIEQMALGEMPPKDKPQPATEQRERLLTWIHAVLEEIGLAQAGDPGPVVLRRLSNAEYTYTIRDLTGVRSLDPAREFPVDGASGEGFMNVGNSLVMSPSFLVKYLDAGKEIAGHAMLLPDGIRFSAGNTRRDWTEELLAEIRTLYGRYTVKGGGTAVNLQGIKFDTKDGGVLPLEKYLEALLEARERGVNADSAKLGLSPKYLESLLETLNDRKSSILLDPIRARWLTAKSGGGADLAAAIAQWQSALWKFNSVGHIGKAGGPKVWLEPHSPAVLQQEFRLKLPAGTNGEVVVYLSAGDVGDGNENDFVNWQEPRLIVPGQPPIYLRELRQVFSELTAFRERTIGSAAKCLEAAAEAGQTLNKVDVGKLARKHGVAGDSLEAWLDYLGLVADGSVKINSYLTNAIKRPSGHDFINGWGNPETPNLTANASDQHVRIPGNMKPHSVAVHPSPKLQAVVGWLSPVQGVMRINGTVQHAHPECGNGVTWTLELRRGSSRQRLASGVAHGGKPVELEPVENLSIRPGDLISMLIGARDSNHSCDLTAVDLMITSLGENEREWNLARDVSPDVLAGNPHADRFGNADIWHFYTEPDKGGAESSSMIPARSLLAKWRSASGEEQRKIAQEIQKLITSVPPMEKESPDGRLHQQINLLGGPLFTAARKAMSGKTWTKTSNVGKPAAIWGLDPASFGKRSNGSAGETSSLYLRAPSEVEIRLPSELTSGAEFVTTGSLDKELGMEGSVQLQVLTHKPAVQTGLNTTVVTQGEAVGPWYSNNRKISHAAPIIVSAGSVSQKRIEADLEHFRQMFPAALCYTKIVPVDEVVTLTLFHREDDHFARLLLDEHQRAGLERLWSELRYISQDALTLVDVFDQLWQYATQDADPSVFEPMREPIKKKAATFREWMAGTQPRHVEAVLKFAERAYRRPLSASEQSELGGFYHDLRRQEMPHEEAVRLTLARVLVAPAFLYHAEKPAPGKGSGPVDNWEIASRLSYFLWSSMPDAELLKLAAAGKLADPAVLVAQSRRMMREPHVRRMATEFACAWLHLYGFDELSEKSDRHFPSFSALRGAMYEETIRFFTDLFQNDQPVLNILDADYAFMNGPLAQHYGIPNEIFLRGRVEGVGSPETSTREAFQALAQESISSNDWRRVEGVKTFSRGGILGQATALAKQSGASRTSPILRGNWVSEVLLGEKLPRPPKDVPRLPEDEATENLTVRQLTEKHTSDPRCAGCHARIDAFGFALERFDAIGGRRDRDLGGHAIDTRSKVFDGSEIEGLEGLREYLLTKRGDAFLKQFCRKLLGYSLGRAVQLSDGPLINEMLTELKVNKYRVSSAIETIVKSKQFRQIRGKEMGEGLVVMSDE